MRCAMAHATSQATRAYHMDLINWGMLISDSNSLSLYRTTPKGEAYIEALKCVSERFVPDWHGA
jgi:predicted transcriptional regulator